MHDYGKLLRSEGKGVMVSNLTSPDEWGLLESLRVSGEEHAQA